LQSLLVGVDLASVTVGQLRGRLEERLGLGVGALSSRKKLKRQVSWAVQQEVAKKARRSNDCDRIVKALIEFEEYPENARQMLIDSLPLAVNYVGEPHPHQARLLQIVIDALFDARRGIEEKIEESKAGLCKAEEEHHTISERTDETNAFEAEKAGVVTAAEAALNAARQSFRQAEEDAKEASLRLQTAVDELTALQERKKKLCLIVEGSLQMLLDGTWTEESARDAALALLQQHLGDLGVESAMLDAVPVALARLPTERGGFDVVTAAEVKRLLTNELEERSRQIASAEANRVSMETDALAAAALLGASRESMEAVQMKLEGAQAEHAAAVHAVKASVVKVASSARIMELCKSERDLYGGRLQELQETIELVQRFIDGSQPLASSASDGGIATTGASSCASDAAPPQDSTTTAMEADSGGAGGGEVTQAAQANKGAVTSEETSEEQQQLLQEAATQPVAEGSPSAKDKDLGGEKSGSPHATTWPPPTPQRTSNGGRLKGSGPSSPLQQTD
jgi:DNA repair exonuclease SbcCD ATPase subunit